MIPTIEQNCTHDKIQGNPKSGGICLDCHEVITSQQMASYRQFGMLTGASEIYVRSDFGNAMVNKVQTQLISSKKLVLVLDLDNTLLHSREFPLTKEMARSKKFRQRGVCLYDSVKSRYHMWDYSFSYLVKLRPFVRYFLEMALTDFEIYFYTAATRIYGDLAVQILKLEMLSQEISDSGLKRRIENTFVPGRLISRDDKERF